MTKDELRAGLRKATADAAPEPQTNLDKNIRTNKYGQTCARCKNWVEPGEGQLGDERGLDGRYEVVHFTCPGIAPAPVAETPKDRLGNDLRVWPGTYTLPDEFGHVTLRVVLQPEDADFAPGEEIVERLVGRDNESDYQGFGFISRRGRVAIWRKHRLDDGGEVPRYVTAANLLVTNPEAFLESKACIRCGRTLTTPESIAAGIGPVCEGRAT